MLSALSLAPSPKPAQLPAPSSPTSTALAGLDDELHDARRVLSQGQEEDLRYALDRALNKVVELTSLLKTALKTQTELETQLNLAKSNLQLVISNNEMLEEALRRETPWSARDVGWRRWSAREVQSHNAANSSEDRPRSLDYGPLNDSGRPAVPSSSAVPPLNGAKPAPATPSTPQPTQLVTGQENRFFRFRFSSGNTRSPSLSPHPSHLTSPSLPSLVPNVREKEIVDLQDQLERERQARKAADAAKTALEAELESLSQALFEEANRMVASERMRRAETEEELNQARSEKDALREALELVEGENGRLRSANTLPGTPKSLIDRSGLPSQLPVILPLRSSPKPPSPQPPSPSRGTSTSNEIPLTKPSYEMTVHLADFVLQPAPSLGQAGLHRKTAPVDGTTELPATALKEVLPVIAASPPVPFLPDDPEPSPWADVAS